MIFDVAGKPVVIDFTAGLLREGLDRRSGLLYSLLCNVNLGALSMAIAPSLIATNLTEAQKQELYDEVTAWNKLVQKIAPLVAEEKELRKKLCSKWFEDPREGTNKIVLGFGKELKMTYTITRKLDEAALDAASLAKLIDPELVGQVVKYKPAVSVTGWKELSADQRAKFKDIITEEPGSPQLKIETPKR